MTDTAADDRHPDREGRGGFAQDTAVARAPAEERDTTRAADEPDTAARAPAEEREAAPASSPRVHLTAAALEVVREMLAEEGLLEAGGLRLSARPGAGCSAPMQFGLVLDEGPDPGDVVLEGRGIRIFMDSRSVWGLDGLQVDYVDAPGMGAGFAFRRPRGADGCAG